MNFHANTRLRRVTSLLSTLSLVAYSSTLLTPVCAQTADKEKSDTTTPEKAKQQDTQERRKNDVPPAPGNPAVLVDPNTGAGNNTHQYNKDGTPRTPRVIRRDYGDHKFHPNDPRAMDETKSLPLYGLNYFEPARQLIEARRNGLRIAVNGYDDRTRSDRTGRADGRNGMGNGTGVDKYGNASGRNGNAFGKKPRSQNNVDEATGKNRRDNDDDPEAADMKESDADAAARRKARRSDEASNAAVQDEEDINLGQSRKLQGVYGGGTVRRATRDSTDQDTADDSDDTTASNKNDSARTRRNGNSTDESDQDNQDSQGTRNSRNNQDSQGTRTNSNNQDTQGTRSSRNNQDNQGTRTNRNNPNNQGNQDDGSVPYVLPAPRSTASAYDQIIDPLTQLTSNFAASAPANYQLSGGDELVIHISTPKLPPQNMTRTIDPLGYLDMGEMGRLIVRGKTLDQLQDDLQKRGRRYYKDADVSVNLKQLRTIPVTVQGEAVLPGQYVVPAVASAFNVLYAAGGPTEDGSLREIKIMRQGREIGTLDFYKFMSGGGQEDTQLRAGDVIVIPPVGARIAVSGEVRHPALFEIKDDENLKDALRYAGGVKASGVDQIVQLNTLEPGQNRVLKNVNLRDKVQVANARLYDGDSVEIHSLRQIVDNKVHVAGAISQPGDYALTPGMRVTDLIRMARNPLSEAYLGRAALKRWNSDNTTTLIPIDLAKAIEGDATNNLPLMKWDSLEIYSQSEAAFVGTRKVEVRGAVQREGIYEYSQNMRVSDILLRAGGPMQNAERIELIHQHGDGTYKIESILVADVAHGGTAKDVLIEDNDVVAVYKNTEAQFIAQHTVRVEGEVVKTGFYPRGEGMRLTDALRLAGGFRPGAHASVKIAHARRSVDNPDANQGIVAVKFDSQQQCAAQDDVRLEDGDVIAVQGTGGIEERPAVVLVKGAVNSPGPIILKNKNVRLSDAIKEAGGLRPEAFPEGAEFNRNPKLLSSKTQRELAVVVGQLSNLLNDSKFKSALAKSDIERIQALGKVNDDSSLIGGQSGGALNNAATTTIAGELSKHQLVTEPRRLTDKELDPSGNIAVNLPAALDEAKRGGRLDDDILLVDGDTIIVPEKPTTVQVIGAVTNQRGVLYAPGKSLDFYVSQAGDFTPDAARDRIVVIHAGGGIIPARKVKELRPGDVILVPTKVLAEKISRSGNGFSDFFKSITNSAILFKVATGVFGL